MKLTITVTTETGHAYDVVTSLATMVEWERKYQRRAGDLAAGFFIEDLAYLAYASEKRDGALPFSTFDEWLAHVDGLEVKDTAESHPTVAAPIVGN